MDLCNCIPGYFVFLKVPLSCSPALPYLLRRARSVYHRAWFSDLCCQKELSWICFFTHKKTINRKRTPTWTLQEFNVFHHCHMFRFVSAAEAPKVVDLDPVDSGVHVYHDEHSAYSVSKINEYKRIKSSWVDTGGFEHCSLFGLHRDSCRPWSESSWRSGQFLLDACHAAAIVTYSPWQKGGAETMRVGDRSLNFKHHVPGNFLRSRCAKDFCSWIDWPNFLSFPQGRALFAEHISNCLSWSRWWFQIVIIFTPIWGRFPFWLIFFRWVETTNQ